MDYLLVQANQKVESHIGTGRAVSPMKTKRFGILLSIPIGVSLYLSATITHASIVENKGLN